MILQLTQALLNVVGNPYAESIAGDLQEEFILRRSTLGLLQAARWYTWQLGRSLSLPLAIRLLAISLPLFVLDRIWVLFFEQLCLLPAAGLVPANGLCLCAGAFLTRPSLRVAMATLLGFSLASGLMVGEPAFQYIFSGFVAVPVGMLAAAFVRAGRVIA